MGFGNILGPSSLQQKSLAALPSAAGLATGTSFEITNYGGNIATVVAGAWRFEYPFRTTWAGRPPVGLVPVGTELQVTDYANQKWINDGTVWRPAQGRILLAQKNADGYGSIAVLTGVTSGEWAITKPILKGGMGVPGAKLRVEGLVIKVGTSGTFIPAAYLGTTGSMATDPAIGSVGATLSTDAAGIRWDMYACFGSNENTYLRSGSIAPQGQIQGNIIVQSVNVNTASDMSVTFGMASGFATDAFHLKSYAVWLEA